MIANHRAKVDQSSEIAGGNGLANHTGDTIDAEITEAPTAEPAVGEATAVANEDLTDAASEILDVGQSLFVQGEAFVQSLLSSFRRIYHGSAASSL